MAQFRGMFLPVAVLAYIQMCYGTGWIEVHFLSYTNTCREPFFDNVCDPFFRFCLSRPGWTTMSNCQYGRVGPSEPFRNKLHINFGHNRFEEIPNPWRVRVHKFYDSKIQLGTEVINHDRYSSDEHMHTWRASFSGKVWQSRAEAQWATIYSRPNIRHSPKLYFKIRLYCDPNYYSSKCDVYCQAQDAMSGHYTCDKTSGRKVCMPGWEGYHCERDIDECEDDSDTCNAGTCQNSLGSYSCACPAGYSGDHCETLHNPCSLKPCVHGVCFAQPDRYEYSCKCEEGWEGKQCQEKTEPCDMEPCLNGGTCVSSDHDTSYNCSCSYPYTGLHCETLVSTTTTTTTAAINTTAEQYIIGKFDTTRQKHASEDSGVDIWLVELIFSLGVLALVTILLFFVLRQRMGLSRGVQAASPSELPSLLVFGSTDTDADLDEGAVGGCKTGGENEEKTIQKKLLKTFFWTKKGRAQPNDYADVLTLCRTKFLGRANENQDNLENERRDTAFPDMPHENLKETDEPHYASLDDVQAQVRSIQALPPLVATLPEVSTCTLPASSANEYNVPTEPTPVESQESSSSDQQTESQYSNPRDSGVEPQFLTPRVLQGENQYSSPKGEHEYSSPRDQRVSPDYQTPREAHTAVDEADVGGGSKDGAPTTTATPGSGKSAAIEI